MGKEKVGSGEGGGSVSVFLVNELDVQQEAEQRQVVSGLASTCQNRGPNGRPSAEGTVDGRWGLPEVGGRRHPTGRVMRGNGDLAPMTMDSRDRPGPQHGAERRGIDYGPFAFQRPTTRAVTRRE